MKAIMKSYLFQWIRFDIKFRQMDIKTIPGYLNKWTFYIVIGFLALVLLRFNVFIILVVWIMLLVLTGPGRAIRQDLLAKVNS